MSKTNNPTWTAIRQHLKSWESEALIALIKDLHDSSSVNRDFLHARVTAASGNEASFTSYRKRVTDPFYPGRGQPKLKLGEARKAIREYPPHPEAVFFDEFLAVVDEDENCCFWG